MPLLPPLHSPNKDLNTVPDTLWAKNFTAIGKIIGTEPIKVQRDPMKPLPKLCQYLLHPETKKKSEVYLEALRGLPHKASHTLHKSL